MKAQITLKSGAQVVVDINPDADVPLRTTRDRFTGNLTEMIWATPATWSAGLHTIDLGEVAAVVILRDPADQA